MKRNTITKLLAWIIIFAVFVTILPANMSTAKEKQVVKIEKQQYIVVMKDKKAKEDILTDLKNKVKIKNKNVGKLPAIIVEMTEQKLIICYQMIR